MTMCVSADSDPDGDGWGWENNASCQVEATAAEPRQICQLDNSDPDGDGWGWEDGRSCQVEPASTEPEAGTSPIPGNSIENATPITAEDILQSEFTNLNGENNTHWYSLEVTDPQFAYVLSGSRSGSPSGYADVVLESADNRIQMSLFLDNEDSVSSTRCLPAGRYNIVVYGPFYLIDAPVEYRVELTQTSLQCVNPVSTVNTKDTLSAFTTIPDGYVYGSNFDSLSAFSHAGDPLWSLSDIPADSITLAEDGILYAWQYNRLSAITTDGNLLWTYEVGDQDSISNLTADASGIYVVLSANAVVSLYPDGRERWMYHQDSIFGDSIRSVSIGDNGTIYLLGYQGIQILQP